MAAKLASILKMGIRVKELGEVGEMFCIFPARRSGILYAVKETFLKAVLLQVRVVAYIAVSTESGDVLYVSVAHVRCLHTAIAHCGAAVSKHKASLGHQ
jgi:hypothetical protein